jgi:hypothetical protein
MFSDGLFSRQVYAVSPLVNHPSNDSPRCVEPFADA